MSKEQEVWKKSNTRARRNNRYKYNKSSKQPGQKSNENTQKNKEQKFFEEFPTLSTISPKKNIIQPQYTSLFTHNKEYPKQINSSNNITENYTTTQIPSYQQKHTIRRNQIIRSDRNISHDTWELAHFNHILNLSSIFSKHLQKLDLNIDINSFNFLYKFSLFIFKMSSNEISLYLDELPRYIHDLYIDYKSKREIV